MSVDIAALRREVQMLIPDAGGGRKVVFEAADVLLESIGRGDDQPKAEMFATLDCLPTVRKISIVVLQWIGDALMEVGVITLHPFHVLDGQRCGGSFTFTRKSPNGAGASNPA